MVHELPEDAPLFVCEHCSAVYDTQDGAEECEEQCEHEAASGPVAPHQVHDADIPGTEDDDFAGAAVDNPDEEFAAQTDANNLSGVRKE